MDQTNGIHYQHMVNGTTALRAFHPSKSSELIVRLNHSKKTGFYRQAYGCRRQAKLMVTVVKHMGNIVLC